MDEHLKQKGASIKEPLILTHAFVIYDTLLRENAVNARTLLEFVLDAHIPVTPVLHNLGASLNMPDVIPDPLDIMEVCPVSPTTGF